MANQLNPCVCALVNSISKVERDLLVVMIQQIKALFLVMKSQEELVNINWSDQLKLTKLQLTLQAYETIAQPAVTPIKGIKRLILPWIDCTVNQTVMELLNHIEKKLLDPVEELQTEIAALENEIDQQEKKQLWYDSVINFLDDFSDMLDKGCEA